MASLINLTAFVKGLVDVSSGRTNLEGPFLQMLIAGFAVLNCWPIFDAIFIRSDSGKMPIKTTLVATFLAVLELCKANRVKIGMVEGGDAEIKLIKGHKRDE